MANYQDSSSAPVVKENDRALSFGTVAKAYSEYRPNYPDAAIGWALAPLAAPMHVLDLAAGTGKLTASLVRRPGTTVTAVEPDPNMLAVLRAELPEVTAMPGTAEQIPLPDDSVHAVLVGQAFHWFDHERALTEIARVLRPGGVVGALWNHEDGSVGWVAGYHEAENRERRVAGMKTGGDAPEPLVHPAFEPVERSDFDHSMPTTVNRLIGTLSTHSWSLVSTPEEREAAYGRIRAYLAGVPELGLSGAGGEDREFELPLRTIVLRAVLRDVRR